MVFLAGSDDAFPEEVKELLRTLHGVGFFEDSVLVRSWVMSVYGELFGILYPLRTMDIDFGLELVAGGKARRADLEKLLVGLGYLPSTSQSGVQRFTRAGFTVEFLAHRRGGRDEGALLVRAWNVTAQPLPFLDLLLKNAFWVEYSSFRVRAPWPEAFFIHKLITAQRRPEGSKREKDLEQCMAVAPKLEAERLAAVAGSLRLGKETRAGIRASCVAIGFPPHRLGLG